MKKIMTVAAILAASVTFTLLSSCNKDDDKEVGKPQIIIKELGHDNSKTAYIGDDFHIEADIIAEGRIDKVTVEIHHEGDHGTKSVIIIFDGDEWEVDTTYTKFSGLKNTYFHEDYDIPVYAEEGGYHFLMIVTDMEGNQTKVEDEIEIKQHVE